jgi:hypothetical protein
LTFGHCGFVPQCKGIEFCHSNVDLGMDADLRPLGERLCQEKLRLAIDVPLW